ncbi:MAG: RNB domain-containing ribonuclease [Candidatus Obscuribacterales bacterium]|nr:RNB domain-containing ribonuclease [Candidatus Obscuribacterales bacterium]
MTSKPDLKEMARQALEEAGFTPDFEPAAIAQVDTISDKLPATSDTKDLRHLLWSSIDNADSMDLDQVEYAEALADGNTRVMVGIADVDAFVNKDSPLDVHAFNNTVTVYAGVKNFGLFPEKLSCEISSLLPGADKLAVVADMVLNAEGKLLAVDVYRALVRNYAKLNYSSIGKWFDGGAKENELPLLKPIPKLAEQLRLQRKVAELLEDLRMEAGALNVERIEATPVTINGRVVDIKILDTNDARDLVENFMVAANSAVAGTLDKKGTYSLRRIVRKPKRWPRIVELAKAVGETLPAEPSPKALSDFLKRRRLADPTHFSELSLSILKLLGPGEYVVVKSGDAHEGHFGLAVQDYTHSTAPNRRYPDLVTQRLLKAVIDGKECPYSEEELEEIARRCTKMASSANTVERFMRKAAAAVLLSSRLGEVFKAIVTGVKEDGVYVRISKPSAEGRLVKNHMDVDVGDKIKVRLLSTNAAKGFIDFEKI